MNSNFSRILLASVIVILCSNCNPGYKLVDGKWAWISYDEAVGRRVKTIDADPKTFEIIQSKYGADHQRVYLEGSIIKDADPQTFTIIGEGYSKDHVYVYYKNYKVLGAEPNSFEILSFPYSRDAKELFCGTIPLGVSTPMQFKVIRGGSGTTTTSFESSLFESSLAESLHAQGVSPDETIVISFGFGYNIALAKVGAITFKGCIQEQ